MEKPLNNNENLNLLIFATLSFASVMPSIYFLTFGYVPSFWLIESGLYETAGAAACFIAGLLNLANFKASLNQKRRLGAFWLLLLSLACIFIAGEEISWGQHFFNYELSEGITSNNFQGELNLHNSMLVQSSNQILSTILFRMLMAYFIALPVFLIVFPTFEKWVQQMMIPIPSMLIALIALIAKAGSMINYKILSDLHGEVGEALECIFEICLLILAFEIFYYLKNNRTNLR